MKKFFLLCLLLVTSLACSLPAQLLSRYQPDQETPSVEPALSTATSTPFQPVAPVAVLPTAIPLPSETPTLTILPSITPQPTVTYQPKFEPGACRFPIPTGTSPECGEVWVPENRSHPGGRQVGLQVAIFRSRASQPAPDPVIYLSGGPGSSALDVNIYLFNRGFGKILESRDLIFFDQRGTGYSQPALTCPEVQQARTELLSYIPTSDEFSQKMVEAYQHCHDRLAEQGVDFTAYNSAASAADVDDLRKALGYDRVNLYGDSYGTRLALTVMRDYPLDVRSAILDSVYPPQADLYLSLAANAERAFNVLFDRCADDSSCNRSYPDLRTTFYQLVERLDEKPVELIMPQGWLGAGNQVVLTGGLFEDVLFTGLYNREVISGMPALIAQVNRGVYDSLYPRLSLYFQSDSSSGMGISVQCHEELPFGSSQALLDGIAGVRPEVGEYFSNSVAYLYQVCNFWGAGAPDPIENQPVRSDLPSLVLTGEYDPITPPAWSQESAQYLSHSYFYEYPAVGHWTLRSGDCPLTMALAFLQEPTQPPDSGCMDLMGGLKFR